MTSQQQADLAEEEDWEVDIGTIKIVRVYTLHFINDVNIPPPVLSSKINRD